jgi:peptide deformylase
MAILEILTYPNPVLRLKTKPVTVVDDRIQTIIDNMAETMYAAPGTGLAAIQVGIAESILVYDLPSGNGPDRGRHLHVLINPVIVAAEGAALSENEGCLSIPDFRADVRRAARVRVEALDRNGQPVVIEDDGFHAIVLQHEIDHLNGILFIDRISSLKRGIYQRRVRKQQRQADAG